MSPITHPLADTFLLGYIAACSLVAALFFCRFWKQTRDLLFLGFAIFFAVQGVVEVILLDFPRPNEGIFWLSLLRFVPILAVIAAILLKNSRE
jgi:uncharacterized membrane protein HdeD (DUF308 family)